MKPQQLNLPESGAMEWLGTEQQLINIVANSFNNTVRLFVDSSSIEDVMEFAIVTAKRLTDATQIYIFIESQGHRDEPISIYKSLPPHSEIEIRRTLLPGRVFHSIGPRGSSCR